MGDEAGNSKRPREVDGDATAEEVLKRTKTQEQELDDLSLG